MKKLLTFLLIVFALAFSYNARADQLNIGCYSDNADLTVSKAGISGSGGEMILSQGGITISSNGGYYSGAHVRVYKDKTLTISSTVGKITEIKVYFTSTGYAKLSGSNFSISSTTGTWTNSSGAESVTLNATAQTRFTSITVTYTTGGVTPQPTTYSLTLPTGLTGGTVTASGASDLTAIPSGTDITVTATPATGYTLEWMKANGVDVSNPYEFVINATTTITASFVQEQASTTEWVLTTPSNLRTGDVVLIVDKYSSRAMSNDKGTDAAPSATLVTLNSNKDKVTAGVTAALQWTVTNTNGTYNFTVPGGTTYLYCTNTNNGVRVGTGNAKNFVMTGNGSGVDYLTCTGTTDTRYLGVYDNSDWRCYKSMGDNIASTVVAFYKKVETGSHSVTVGTITGEGTITPSSGSANTGDAITVTATPATGYELTALAYNGNAIDITSTPYTFTMPNADVTLTATFSLKDYVVAYQVTPSTAAANTGNRVGLISGAPYDSQSGASHSQMGTSVTFKLYTGNGWKIDDANVSVAYTDANGNPATLTPTKGETNSDDGGYGTYFTFNMPGSDVMINAAYLPYQPDLYILGNVNGGTHWNDGGLKMTFNPSANTYSIRIYASEENGYFRFYANGGNNGNPSYGAGGVNLNPLEGTQPKDLWKDGDANFCVPAGIYDIVVGQIYDDPTTNSNPNWWRQTTVTVTAVEPTFTFNPADGSTVYQGTNVTVTSNLYDLLHAINSDITESSVTNEVSLDGTTFSSSVALDNTGSSTVTGKATYGYIAPTATANYTVNEAPAGDIYELVTSTNDLAAGDKIVIMSEASGSDGHAMGAEQTNNFKQTINAITVTDKKIVVNSTTAADAQILTLEGNADDGWYFKTSDDRYLYAASSGSNHLKADALTTAGDNAKATIEIASNGSAATVQFQGSNTRNLLKYNSGSDLFSCYGSGQSAIYLFKSGSNLPTVATPTFSVAEGTYSEAQSVEISCSTSGATILYSTDGENYSPYTGAITVDVTTTLYAKATKEGYNPSAVARATYTINIPVVGEGDFVLVTNANQLVAGQEYIIVVQDLTYGSSTSPSHAGTYALSAANAGTSTAQANARKAVNGSENIVLAEGYQTATVPAGSEVEIFHLEGSAGAWKLHGTNGYLYGVSGQNYLNISETELNSGWDAATISIESGSVAKIQFNEDNEGRYIQCNPNNQSGTISPYFSCYKSTSNMKAVYLYTRESNTVQKPVFTPAAGVYGIDVEVSISCPTSGATILYSTDGTNFQAYTEAITVSETTTLYAKAVKGEETSDVVSAEYTISKNTDIATVTLTYSEPLTEGVGNFYVENEGEFSPVWTLDGNYGIKGTSYHAGTNYAATSWFISPLIDMTDAVQPELTFSHQINSYFTNPGTQCTLWIREGSNGAWQPLNGLTFSDPAANGGWTNDFADIDLSDYAGKTVQIGFKYNNPVAGTGAGTWNIQYFYVADNSEYKLVNNIAEFLALENGEKAKFRNPVTVLYDYSQHSSNTYQEYIWVKDESGYTNIFLAPSLDGHYNTSYQRAYYENGDVIPAGFVVTKNYYENGGYIQAMANPTSENEYSGFLPATQKALADPEHFELSTLDGMATDAATVEQYNNRYISFNKVQIVAGSGKYFTIKDENGNTIDITGYNKYSDANSLLKDGETTAVVTLPGEGLYNVTAILQTWQNGWEVMPITFTPWEEKKVTLRELCASGVTTDGDNHYTISNNLLAVYANDNVLWLKDDTGQSIQMTKPASGEINYPISETDNTRQDQAFYDQSNWLQVEFAAGFKAERFVNKIINGGAIKGNFTDKLNPTLTGATALTDEDIYAAGSYDNNFYCMANFAAWPAGADHLYQTAAAGVSAGSNFFFMNPKPQEYAKIAYAVWMGNDTFVIPAANGGENGNDFDGAITVAWDYNDGASAADLDNAGQGNQVYKFNAIIKKAAAASGAPRRVAGKDGQSASGYVVYPTNLTAGGTSIITAVDELQSGKAVYGVRYVNVAGQVAATPWQGVNIVVTRYTDGSTRTTKVVK